MSPDEIRRFDGSSIERWVGRDLRSVSACPKYDMAWELVNFLNVKNNAVRM